MQTERYTVDTAMAHNMGGKPNGIESCRLIVYVVTDPVTANGSLRGHLKYVASLGHRVVVIASPGHDLCAVKRREQVETIAIPMSREISPICDIVAAFRLIRILWKLRPAVVNAGTPKAGLLAMVAATVARVRVRIYVLKGLRLETTAGWKYCVLWISEWLAAKCAHRVVCVSESLRNEFIRRGLGKSDKAVVLGAGTSNGVNCDRFSPRNMSDRDVAILRQHLGISNDARVVGFVGRLVRDKGIVELIRAFDLVRKEVQATHLLLLGDFENGDCLPEETVNRIRTDHRITITGFVPDAQRFYRVMDVLAFPSHREGFPKAPIEAAATGIPTVGFDVTGTRDAIISGRTGYLVEKGAIDSLAFKLIRYLTDDVLRREHGLAGREWVFETLRPQVVWKNFANLYSILLRDSVARNPRNGQSEKREVPIS